MIGTSTNNHTPGHFDHPPHRSTRTPEWWKQGAWNIPQFRPRARPWGSGKELATAGPRPAPVALPALALYVDGRCMLPTHAGHALEHLTHLHPTDGRTHPTCTGPHSRRWIATHGQFDQAHQTTGTAPIHRGRTPARNHEAALASMVAKERDAEARAEVVLLSHRLAVTVAVSRANESRDDGEWFSLWFDAQSWLVRTGPIIARWPDYR